MRLNGAKITCREGAFKDLALAPPAKIRLPNPRVELHYPVDFLDDEDFLTLQAEDPEIAKYAAKKARTKSCATRVRAKIDPDRRAGHYDLVTTDARGRTKVESFGKVVWRKINAQCKLGALWKERDRIYARLKSDGEAAQRRRAEAFAKRVGRPVAPNPTAQGFGKPLSRDTSSRL